MNDEKKVVPINPFVFRDLAGNVPQPEVISPIAEDAIAAFDPSAQAIINTIQQCFLGLERKSNEELRMVWWPIGCNGSIGAVGIWNNIIAWAEYNRARVMEKTRTPTGPIAYPKPTIF